MFNLCHLASSSRHAISPLRPTAVRNPWDVVVSAYWYHLQTPAPETWIDKPVRIRCWGWMRCGLAQHVLAGRAACSASHLAPSRQPHLYTCPALPCPTPCLPQLSTRLGMMREAGVPTERLQALGIGEEHAAMGYGDALRALPEEAGVQLEFWRSAEGALLGAGLGGWANCDGGWAVWLGYLPIQQ